jgi:hypothetical protein
VNEAITEEMLLTSNLTKNKNPSKMDDIAIEYGSPRMPGE